jgi:hypothetical protein
MADPERKRKSARIVAVALASTLALGSVGAAQDALALGPDAYRPVVANGTLRVEAGQTEAAVVLRFASSYDEEGTWTTVPFVKRLVVEGISFQGVATNTTTGRPTVMSVALAGEARWDGGITLWFPRWQHYLSAPGLVFGGEVRFPGAELLRLYAQGGGTRAERLVLRVKFDRPVAFSASVAYSVSGYLH